jgi:hypothetical protein
MIYQVCQANPTLTPFVNQRYKSFLGRILNSHAHPCGEILETLLSGDQPVYMVLDGLDECAKDQREQLTSTLLDLGRNCPNLHISVSSRKEVDITRTLEPNAEVVTVEEKNKGDIKHFVSQEIKHLCERVQADAIPGVDRFFQDLQAKIVFQSGGITSFHPQFSAKDFLLNFCRHVSLREAGNCKLEWPANI